MTDVVARTESERTRRLPTSSKSKGPHRNWSGLLFALPLVVMLLAVVVWPVVNLVRYSFTHYDGISPPEPVGLANYEFLLSWGDFQRILINNALLVVGVFIWVVLPFVLAIAIFRTRRGNLVRTILFVPALLPPVIVGIVFRSVLADSGPLNEGLRLAGLDALALGWLSDPRIVLVAVAGVIAWATVGTGVLLYTAGLAAISPSYVEAAKLDGANWRQTVWHIYRPALRPVTRFWTLLLTVVTVTGFFPWIFGLTQGGPGVASTTLDYAIYRSWVQGGQLGRSAAISVIAVAFVTVVVLLQLAFRRVKVSQEWT